MTPVPPYASTQDWPRLVSNALNDLDKRLNAIGGSWIPLVDGAEPPGFITDGAGSLILVAYD